MWPMSSDKPVPATVVPAGITDPVTQARAELKAALAAIEVKANVPKRVAESTERRVEAFRRMAKRNPTGVAAAVVATAAVVGGLVWGFVRLYTR
jgi:hypothetical protein